ncbi:MAG: hypothetical protein MJY82_04060 [Fibrobacter sp.]|nr:hypothetical protein [Fibrobacter sp.]
MDFMKEKGVPAKKKRATMTEAIPLQDAADIYYESETAKPDQRGYCRFALPQ